MPIIRTYACPECMHMLEVTLSMDQVDDPPPECPQCAAREAWARQPMVQEFKPVAITGKSVRAKAAKIAEEIAGSDYMVGDMQVGNREGDVPKVRYKDATAGIAPSTWQAAQGVLEGAIAAGRQSRLKYGNGLDVLQAGLKAGTQPDLIEASKRRAIKVW